MIDRLWCVVFVNMSHNNTQSQTNTKKKKKSVFQLLPPPRTQCHPVLWDRSCSWLSDGCIVLSIQYSCSKVCCFFFLRHILSRHTDVQSFLALCDRSLFVCILYMSACISYILCTTIQINMIIMHMNILLNV